MDSFVSPFSVSGLLDRPSISVGKNVYTPRQRLHPFSQSSRQSYASHNHTAGSMGSVEAAASLFGASDSGSDMDFLTAPEGSNSTSSESPAGTRTGGDTSGSNELFATEDSSDLFDVNENTASTPSLFEPQGGTESHPYDQNESHFAQAGAHQPDNAYGYGHDAQSYSDSNGHDTHNYDEGWYDEHGQWHAYEQHQGSSVTTDHTGNNTVYSPTDTYGKATDANIFGVHDTNSQYNVQAGNSTSAFGYQGTYVPPSSSAQTIYDPYRPAAPTGQQQASTYDTRTTTSPYDPYRQAGVSPQQTSTASYTAASTTSYDPYKPVTPNSLSPPDNRSPLRQSSTFVASGSFVPSPTTPDNSKPSAPPYRPPTANAYDPPIPIVKPKKSFTASAFQRQSSPYSPHGVTSPPPLPPPARKVSSPPQPIPSLPPGPPPRSSVRPPLRASGVSYARPPVRSGSPYDPPTVHRYGSPKPSSYGRGNQPQADGQYALSNTASPPRSRPVDTEHHTSYSSAHAGYVQRGEGLQRPVAPHHDPRQYELHTKSLATTTEGSIGLDGGESTYSPSHNVDPSVADDFGTSSVPRSPHSPVSQRRTSQSPVSGRRVRMSPDVTLQPGGSQRPISPARDSARSRQDSLGRSSPFNSRGVTSFVGQSFSALDEESSRHDEPYSFLKRASLDRAGSPGSRSAGSLGNYAAAPPATIPPSSHSHSDHDAVDLTNDSASLNGQANSPTEQKPSFLPAATMPYDQCKPKSSDSNAQGFADTYQSPVQPVSDPYSPVHQHAPARTTYGAPEARERSMSNISTFTASTSTSYDPYAPSIQTAKQQEIIPYTSNPPAAASFGSFESGIGGIPLEPSYSPPPVTGPYAPSPSLLGLNDPLGRASVKVPVVSFGFGGKLVACFHSPPTLDTGFDVALSSRKCTDVHIRLLQKVIPESFLNESTATYPGPLFGDPGSPVTTIVRAAGSTNAKSKTKKAKVLTYLNEREQELESGLGYLTAGSVDKRRAEGKLTLVRLLHALVEHDGQLYGSPSAESAARAALVQRLASSQDTSGANAFLNAPTAASLATGTFGLAGSNEKPLVEYAVRRLPLETIQDFLLRGEKRKAYHYALDERMWAHAMVISSSIDKEAFKEVVNEFVRAELGVKSDSRSDAPASNGLESLRLAYSLYSGQSSTAVQHLLPVRSLQTGPSLTLQPPTPLNHMTPLSPNFPSPSQATNIPPEILSQWPEYAAMLFSGQMGAESSSALTTLGDYLISNDWVEAAHCCYLLSPQSSPIGGVGTPSVRVVLVGSHSPHRNTSFYADHDAFIFSEILEFALSLHTPAKGQEAFSGFPHLQVYRLIQAFHLAEMGQTALAKRYCEAITATPFRPSPYLSPLFSERLKELYNRLNGDPELDKSNSWIGGKIAKPSLDGFGDWLGGTLTKFVAGETEPASPTARENPLANNPAYAGAFSRYSNISSTNNSRRSSPVPSFTHGSAPPSIPPGRTGSAAGFRSVPNHSPSSRASPAIDYGRPEFARNIPPPRPLASEPSTGAHSYDGNANGHHIGNGSAVHENGEKQPQGEGGWWKAAYDDSNGPTPTVSSFVTADTHMTEAESGGSGFISLMDNYSPFTPSPSAATFTNRKVEEPDDFDDDLGLGNNTNKKKEHKVEEEGSDSKPEKEEPKKEDSKKLDTNANASSSSSWFGRWFSRPSSTKPAPIKANLGEEKTFYYDKELKRWVNKNAGAGAPKSAAPPPPPSRAQTASPSRSAHLFPSGPPPPSPMPPPRRPSSAMDAGSSAPPKRNLTPLRSSLIPEEGSGPVLSAPPTPAVMSSLSAAPPTGRPKSAAKKPVRSRYVNVLQQPS